MKVLVVDAANVVGSRPDGWWRDRPGAARRLHAQLSESTLPYDEIVLVLEGQAKSGSEAGQDGCVRTVHAARSGDDTIVQTVRERVGDGDDVVVVTADRALRDRIETEGARSMGPSSLLDQL